MALIDDVKSICSRLAGSGWRDLLLQFGLDIEAANLKVEMNKTLPKLAAGNRPPVPGFEDFSLQATRGVEPGVPDRSLMFHALASPQVVRKVDGTVITKFPTPREIETVENYIYSLNGISASVPDLKSLVAKRIGVAPANPRFAIVVFAQEYRNASQSVHRLEAGMCFSRTGIARVGTAGNRYSPADRGYHPSPPGQPSDFCVLPARYAAYIAWQAASAGGGKLFGPMRRSHLDAAKKFWVPIHKLFDGPECIRNKNLAVDFAAHHVNEKLSRIHKQTDFALNIPNPNLGAFPFTIRDAAIAKFDPSAASGKGLLIPTAHPLVERAVFQGQLVAYQVPSGGKTLSSSLTIPAVHDRRHAPEYVNARHRLETTGAITNLNDPVVAQDVEQTVESGGYFALHHIDYTGDGWIEVSLNDDLGLPTLPAYSLVTAPDFFFSASQRDMMEWVADKTGQIHPVIPNNLKPTIWIIPPLTLADGEDDSGADHRFAVNINLNDFGASFSPNDKTLCGVVALPLRNRADTGADLPEADRHSCLPDAASSVYQPGWDVSLDRTNGVDHLAAYGLGSPFPEDAKLCAALSTFWPAVAPDVARVFEPNPTGGPWPTVLPLTDEEIGITGDSPIDGYRGPRLLPGGNAVECTAFDYADYVDSALDSKFTLALSSKITTEETRLRVLRMARVYRAVGITTTNPSTARAQKSLWAVLSFKEVAPADAELLQAQQNADVSLSGSISRFQVYRHGTKTRSGAKVLIAIVPGTLTTLYVDETRILRRQGGGDWQSLNL
jgi:hypothetical protein